MKNGITLNIVCSYQDMLNNITIKVNKSLTEEEALLQAKTDAKTYLDSYKNPDDYYDKEKKELELIVRQYKNKIDAAQTLDEVSELLENAKTNLNNIKTCLLYTSLKRTTERRFLRIYIQSILIYISPKIFCIILRSSSRLPILN